MGVYIDLDALPMPSMRSQSMITKHENSNKMTHLPSFFGDICVIHQVLQVRFVMFVR